ncbi:hypothetical protein [Tenacibaculum sp.]|uniref:hypothetical protein n=1 Tax=Tenacibaculum sp. TaxID=1906242 RepID=UPI003AA90556
MKGLAKFIKDNALLVIGVLILVSSLLNRVFFSLKDSLSDGVIFKSFDKSKSTLSDVQASAIAERLYTSMSNWGTDETAIFDIFRTLTKYDFAKVYEAFGERAYDNILGITGDFTDYNIDLFGWLNHELTKSEYQKLRELNPSIFGSVIV